MATELVEPLTRRSPNRGWLRGLIVFGCLALAWWAVWLFDPRNLNGTVLFAALVGAQVLDLLAVLGFWHAVWPRTPREALFAPVRGRVSILIVAHGQPVEMVEQTLQAALSMRRRHRVFLADPFERPDLRWLPGWHGATRLSAGMEELNELLGARFLAVFEAGQVPRADFLERLLPYFANRNLALVQAWYSRSGRRRSRVRDAIFRGADALGEAPCVASNYIVRRTALHSVGGFGADQLSLAGSLRLAAAVRADRWQTLYVGAQLAESLGSLGFTSRLAEFGRWTASEVATTVHPARRRGKPVGAMVYTAWTGARHLALLGLPVSVVTLAAAPLLGSLPIAWPVNLAVHLAPYIALRAAVRVVVGASRPVDVPALQPAEQGEEEWGPELTPPSVQREETPQEAPTDSLEIPAAPAPRVEPEPLEPVQPLEPLEPAAIADAPGRAEGALEHLRGRLLPEATRLVTSGLRGALLRIQPASPVEWDSVEVPLPAEPSPALEPAAAAEVEMSLDVGPFLPSGPGGPPPPQGETEEVAQPLVAASPEPPSVETLPEELRAPEPERHPARRRPGRQPVPRPGLAVAAAAWIVTVGAIGAAAFTVIHNNPPQHATSVKTVTLPTYSYYAPVQAPSGSTQPTR